MPKANPDTITTPTLHPSRRALLARSTAALVTGAAAATVARAAPQAAPAAAGEDAELIRLCDRLIVLEKQHDAIYLAFSDDDEADRQAGPLIPELLEIRDRLYAIGAAPISEAGRLAFARAAIASAERTHDGRIMLDDGGSIGSYLAFGLCHSVAEDGAGKPPLALGTTPSRDAELLALCEQFDELTRERSSLFEGENRLDDQDARDAALDALTARGRPLVERLCATRAVTVEGIRAKARSLALWEPDSLHPTGERFWDEDLMASILADLLGSAQA
jgi:hypothetical protein